MDNTRQALIGLFVLCGLALAVLTVVLFGRFDPFRQTQAAEVVFDGSVDGLGVGSPVSFRGVRLGAVSSIAIEHDPQSGRTYIPVKLRIDPRSVVFPKGVTPVREPIPELVRQGLRARLAPTSLIAQQAEISLDFDPVSPARLHPGIAELPEIPLSGTGGGSIAQQLSELPLRELSNQVSLTMASIRSVTDELGRDLPGFLDSTVSTSDKAGQTLDAARNAIQSMQTRIDVTLAGVDRLSATADRQLNGRGADLQALLVSSNQTIAHARRVLVNLEEMTDDRATTRANLEASLNDLSAASASLRSLAADLEQNPRLLLTGRRR
jgi:paraquat-inducible protein B